MSKKFLNKSRRKKARIELHVRQLNYAMAIITICISILLLVSTYHTAIAYKELQRATTDFIQWHKSTDDMQAGSDYLTEQVRYFVMTGNREYLDHYFYESEVTRRRDTALTIIEKEFHDTETYAVLQLAMSESLELMNREYYAMRLKIDGDGGNLSEYPEAVRSVALSDQDSALSAEKKNEKARTMVFDEEYERQKTLISGNVSSCLKKLEEEVNNRQTNAAEGLKSQLFRERILIIAFIIVVLCIVILTALKVFVPLVRAVPHIREEKPIPVTGAYEYRLLAKTYNRMYEVNQQNKEQLSYEASHDALTGVMNRNGFQRLLSRPEIKAYAFIILDVDNFKNINDAYGHEIGDRMLSRVSNILQNVFRKSDFICRIGGDEFAVFITDPNVDKDNIKQKIDLVNEELSKENDSLPAASISAGISFLSKNKNKKILFKEADGALYETKKNGRHGYTFAE